MTVTRWNSTAGPRQTKTAQEAIHKYMWHATQVRVLSDWGESLQIQGITTAEPCEAAVQFYEEMMQKYGGEITSSNYQEIINDFVNGKKTLELSVVDERTTEEEREARAIKLKAAEEVRQITQKIENDKRDIVVAELKAKCPWAVGPEKFKTGSARAAANIKKELSLTFPGIKFSVKSETYSMGNSVRVHWSMGPSDKTVRAVTDKYKDGWFDGMQDLHEYDNSPHGCAVEVVLGRAKHISTGRTDSHELAEHLMPMVREILSGCDDEDIRRHARAIGGNHDFPAGVQISDITGLSERSDEGVFLEDRYQPVYPTVTVPVADPPVSGGSFTIQKHYHDKRGCDFWLVVPEGRLDTDTYQAVLTAARDAGGWQSRKWGKAPSGFGFASEDAAAAFVASQGEAAPVTPTRISLGMPVVAPDKLVQKLRDLADGLDRVIADKTRPMSQNWTHKRGREYDSRVREGHQLERAQQAMRALADAHENGTCPPILRALKTKAEIVSLCANANKTGRNGEYYDSGEPYYTTDVSLALRELIKNAQSEEQKEAVLAMRRRDEIQKAENNLRTMKIPGFFPSPPAVCAELIQRARQRFPDLSGCSGADFSAGIGSICEAMRDAGMQERGIHAVEINSAMAEIVSMKGFSCDRMDFMEIDGNPMYSVDLVLLNPPFERFQDTEHVMKAFGYLKPGGRLVAILGGSVERSDNRKAVEFREWLTRQGSEIEQLDAGLFTGAEAFRQTGVSCCIVTVDRE